MYCRNFSGRALISSVIADAEKGGNPELRQVEDWTVTQTENRYGCFLPDLTGLATGSSIASLPWGTISGPDREKARAYSSTAL